MNPYEQCPSDTDTVESLALENEELKGELSRVREFLTSSSIPARASTAVRFWSVRTCYSSFSTLRECRTVAPDQKMMLAFHFGRAFRLVRKSSALGTV
jgi:hypothetical protein